MLERISWNRELTMRQFFPILKLGTSNKDFPQYASFLHSDGEHLYTCNMSEAVCINYKAPFKGDVNFFVLSGILNKLGDIHTEQKDSSVFISDETTKHEIVIEDVNFPSDSIIKPDFEYIPLQQEIVDVLKIAIKYATGMDVYDKIFIDDNNIISFGHNIIFLREIKTNFKSKTGIDKRILSVLTEGCSIGSVNNNFVVVFEGGFIIFETDSITKFNDSLIKKFFKNRRKNIKQLCSAAELKNAVDKISPIFYGEKIQNINIMNKSNKLTVKGGSVINGTSEASFNSLYKNPFTIDINTLTLNNVNNDFNIYINEEYADCLYLKDKNNNELIIRKAE